MPTPRPESDGGTPHSIPWEAWRHASDGVAIATSDGQSVLAHNPAFERLCQHLNLTPQQCLGALAPELATLSPNEFCWRELQFPAAGLLRVGLMCQHGEPPTVLIMLPAPAHDPDIVTGLADRRRLEEELEARFHGGRPFALLFVDLDGFKLVNDELGHVAGDLALREIAQRMRESLRERDIVGRYGGDEFVVLLDGAVQPEDLELIVQRIEDAAAQPLESVPGAGPLSASIGWAFSADGYQRPADMLDTADRRMYANKRQEC